MTLMVCTCRYRSDVFFRTYLLSTRYVRKHEQRNRIWKRILYVYSNQDRLIVYYFDRLGLRYIGVEWYWITHTDLFAVEVAVAEHHPQEQPPPFPARPPNNRSWSIAYSFILLRAVSRQNHQLYCNIVYQSHNDMCICCNVWYFDYINTITPLKINMEPENTPLEKEKHLPNDHFQVPAVNLRGCIQYMPTFFQPVPLIQGGNDLRLRCALPCDSVCFPDPVSSREWLGGSGKEPWWSLMIS